MEFEGSLHCKNLVPILSKMNPVHIFPLYFSMILSNIIYPHIYA